MTVSSKSTLALCLGLSLLVGCAPQTAPSPNSAVDAAPSAIYLEGISSNYSRPLRELPGEERLPASSAMWDAMISGDGETFVAATAFRQDRYVGMDLIVLNRGEADLLIERDDVRVFDANGQRLSPVHDFAGAEQIGLRGRGESATPSFLYETPVSFQDDPSTSAMPAADAKSNSVEPTGTRMRSDGMSWRALENSPRPGRVAPRTLQVRAGDGRAWWAYWSAEEPIEYPLTAFVMFEGDRQLQFQFRPARRDVAR